jgi:hypothetical protein
MELVLGCVAFSMFGLVSAIAEGKVKLPHRNQYPHRIVHRSRRLENDRK